MQTYCNDKGGRTDLEDVGDHALEGVYTAHAVALNQAVHLHITGHDVVSMADIS